MAGIIGVERNNGVGIDGVADHVEIMSIRTTPQGDERDRDVANGIRYAVDNGADVINMSFGKTHSPEKHLVDEAARYAREHGVLLIHVAGNDGANIDSTGNFPTPFYADGTEIPNWIEVGASSWRANERFVAFFSNYGARSVDLFAPGRTIYSLQPENSYNAMNGTSLAAPVVAGVAALVMSYYPELSAEEVREVLLKSVTSYRGEEVLRPNMTGEETPVDFGSLSSTGGVVDAYRALQLAEEVSSR